MQENIILVKRYAADENIFPVREREIWRYAGYSNAAGGVETELQKLLEQVTKELKHACSYQICCRRMNLEWENGMPRLPFSSKSADLAKCLKGSEEIVLFAATIGFEIDRYIAKNQRFSPAKALLAQAYGAERVECLCDVFCSEIEAEEEKAGRRCTPRFSPGYGDLPLAVQREFFRLLDCRRQIGITLNDSLLITPTKSVTAILGIGSGVQKAKAEKCEICKKKDCTYKC
uniref:vitamin B12 dependent-methionine synthase activation domain-containing protein n=1 Tax=Agathobacter sp. TaxID=2021311 RepID=UPI0040568DA1